VRVLVASWAGSTNLGDELVLAGLLGKLAKREVDVEVVSVDPAATTAAHGVSAVNHRDLPAFWRSVGRADAVVFGGGGLVQDETSAFNLPYHLSRPWLSRLRGRPWAGVGLGAGPLQTRLGRGLVRSLWSATGVSVRDRTSAELLARLGIDGVVVAADLALSLPPPEVEVEDRIVVSLRPWTVARRRAPVGASRKRMQVPPWFLDVTAAALDRTAEETGLGVLFVAFQADRDGQVHERVAERMKTDVEFAAPGVHEIVDVVAAGRVVVGMRYHAGVAAVLGGRPAVLVDYSPKVAGLAADHRELGGGGIAALEFDASSVARIPDAVSKVIDRGEEVIAGRDHLRERERGNDDILDRLIEAAR
jgi:polysaccharide pyruvyl transferase CsaB